MKTDKTVLVALGLVILLTGLAACNSGAAATQSTQDQTQVDSTADKKLKVVATFSILGDLVQNVGGDKIELHTLVGLGGDTHTFEPSPNDGVALVEAKLIFENGLGLETWLDDLYAASRSQAQRVVVTEGLELIPTVGGGHEEHSEPAEHADADGHGHTQGEFDPHVWHDVTNVTHEVKAIHDALAKVDPANAKSYQANAEAYLARLKELDGWIAEEVKKLPEDRRKLITSHDTFGYFARRYGFEVVGSGLGSISTEVGDPSAAAVVSLIEEIKAVDVPAIFAENVSNPKLMEQIAAEAGVSLGPELYTDALGEPGSDGDTYLKLMRYNVTVLVTALGQ